MKKIFSIFLIFSCSCVLANAQFTFTNKLAEYGKIWGFVKFYHYNVQQNKVDWDSVFVKYYDNIKNVSDTSEYNFLITKMLDEAGPVKLKGKPFKYFPEDTTVCNLDFRWIDNSPFLNFNNKMRFVNIIKYYKPSENKYIKKEEGYDYKSIYKTWANEISIPDEAHSFLMFFNYWNRINYFFAYKKLMDTPWDSTLIQFIPKVHNSSGKKDIYYTIAELTTKINDGHGFYSNKLIAEDNGYLLLECQQFDKKVYVTEKNDSITTLMNIYRGEEILKVNGVDVSKRLDDIKKITPSSNNLYLENRASSMIFGAKFNAVNTFLLKDTNGVEKEILFNFDTAFSRKYWEALKTINPEIPFHLIESKYGYMDAGHMNYKQLREAFKTFRKTKAIIIDDRNYGGPSNDLFALRMTNKNVPFAKLYLNDLKYPGSFKVFDQKTNFSFASLFFKKYKGTIVVLIDEGTMSGMEHQTMCFQAVKNAKVIGRNSAGADGGRDAFLVNPFFNAGYTGTAVFYPDGRQTQRIGIVPDIYVQPSLEDAKKKTDTILERAIKYLETGK